MTQGQDRARGCGLAALAAAALMAGWLATPTHAEGIVRSLRPQPNPRYQDAATATASADVVASAAPAAAQGSTIAPLRPLTRPLALEQRVAGLRAAMAEPKGGIDLASLRPESRVEEVAAEPAPKGRKKRGKAAVSAKGSVCGVAAIKGEKIAPIGSKVQGCGLADGVRVTSVSGVRLSMAATIDCATAKALNAWVESAVQPAYGGRVVELKIAGHYVCRPRNNKKGAKVSEHGRGKAIDVSGFVLDNGRTHMVLRGFDRTMRRAYKGACGIFGTTLGPGSDGYHEDHLHLDTANHRNGSYCR